MKKALVILSGGQDSMTCLYWAKETFDEVEAISFIYGQNHEREIEQAEQLTMLENMEHKIILIPFMPVITKSALIENGNVNELRADGLPASFVPNRNALFLTLAHAYAQKKGIDNLVGGMCQTDYSGYPDCRQHFISGMQTVLNYGSNSNITIHTPLMFKTKAETFKLAADLGVLDRILEYSHTCYNNIRSTKHEWGYGCGECPACTLRIKGYNEYVSSGINV